MQRISSAARPHVTVALNGAGGDELFAGYPRYRAMQLSERASWVPSAVPRAAGSVERWFAELTNRLDRTAPNTRHPRPVVARVIPEVAMDLPVHPWPVENCGVRSQRRRPTGLDAEPEKLLFRLMITGRKVRART